MNMMTLKRNSRQITKIDDNDLFDNNTNLKFESNVNINLSKRNSQSL